MGGTERDARRAVTWCMVAVCLWTLPWAAYLMLWFDPWTAPWWLGRWALSENTGFFLLLVYLVDVCFGPLATLAFGLTLPRRSRRWRVIWCLTVAAGCVIWFALVWIVGPVPVSAFESVHKAWGALARAGGLVLFAGVLLALLAGPLRGWPGMVRNIARTATRTARGRMAAAVIAALVAVVGAVALIQGPGPGIRVATGSAMVTAVALGPDGQLAVADSAGLVSVRDPGGTRPVLVIPGSGRDRGPADAFAFSPHGQLLVVGAEAGDGPGATQVWSLVTGRRLFSLPAGPRTAVTAVAVSPDGAVVASGGSKGRITLFDARTGRRLWTARAAVGDAVDSLAFSPDGQELASAAYDGTVRLWRAATGQPVARTAVPSSGGAAMDGGSAAVAVAFPSGGSGVEIAASRSGTYQWAGAGQPVQVIRWTCHPPGSDYCTQAVAFSQDGRFVAVSGQGADLNRTSVWRIGSGAAAGTFEDPAGYAISAAALSQDGESLAAGDYDPAEDATGRFPSEAYVWRLR